MANPIDIPKSEVSGTSSGTVTLAAPGQGVKNYISDLTVISDTDCTLAIAANGSNLFSVPLKANMGYEKAWRRGCGTLADNQAITITVSAGTFVINYTAVTA